MDSTDSEVVLELSSTIKDEQFVSYLEEIMRKKQVTPSIEELVLLERIKNLDTHGITKKSVQRFLDSGIVASVGRSSGTKYILSKQYYKDHGLLGEYTRIRGISREAKKTMLQKHIEENDGGTSQEFQQIFPDLTPKDINNLTQEMKLDRLIEFIGNPKTGKWKLVRN